MTFTPIRLDVSGFAPARLVGAWKLTSPDPRFGGFSALALSGHKLLALTDRGVVALLDRPGAHPATVVMKELPDGPGDARWRSDRDSEALLADAAGRGWWVAFETLNQLWLYDRSFARALARIDFGEARWPLNSGIEGMAVGDDGPLLFIEGAQAISRVRNREPRDKSVEGSRWSFSEALRLPDGRLVAIERTLTPLGFGNALVFIGEAAGAYRIRRRLPLPVGRLDNLEGMAAERTPNGATRLWLISDDNFQRPLRTLLLAVDLPPERKDR